MTFICPDCKNALFQNDNTITCEFCNKKWPLINDIPHFISHYPYWGEINQAEMIRINNEMKSKYWKDVFKKYNYSEFEDPYRMILDLNRSNWHNLISLPKNSIILDIGAGTGAISHALSYYYEQIVAVEPVIERVEFMNMRFEQENINNVQIMRADALNLPFQEKYFDLIVLNGVLEWIPLGNKSIDPKKVQNEFLHDMFKMLKPKGWIYIGIENRLHYYYFLGANDPHFKLPFVTILPRPIAKWYSKKRRKIVYRNYIYSYWGYKKLLKKCGFKNIKIYDAIPSYNRQDFVVPLEKNVSKYFYKNFYPKPKVLKKRILIKLLIKLNILKYLEYSFIIFAQK